jgi:hypothetical protein
VKLLSWLVLRARFYTAYGSEILVMSRHLDHDLAQRVA